MGIEINNSRVSIVEGHERLVATSKLHNPVIDSLDSHKTISAFKRFRDADHNDGNPLVYALKKINDFSIQDDDLERLWGCFNEFSFKALRPFSFDYIIPAPSNNPLNTIMVEKLKEVLVNDIPVRNIFRKALNSEVLELLPSAEELKIVGTRLEPRYSKLNEILGENLDTEFSMKYVKASEIREIVTPLRIKEDFDTNVLKGSKVLVVDDVLSTGSTLKCCANALHRECGVKSLTFFTMFSRTFRTPN